MLKLSNNGFYQAVVQSCAQSFFQSQFPAANSSALDDDRIQRHLLSLSQPEAQLCLRCFISHAIVQGCEKLVYQFGASHHFQLSDLLPLVLDDEANLSPTTYQPFSLQILETFQPSAGNLANWTTRRIRQQSDIKQFLLEHGVYLISPWALLNDTRPEQLSSILPHLHPTEVHRACLLLESYRRIYLPDRLKQRQKCGIRKVCLPPTPEQLQRMGAGLQEKTQTAIAPELLLKQLHTLAQDIRQYRLARRGGAKEGRSLDDPDLREQLEYQLVDTAEDFIMTDHNEFLHRYRQSFQTTLETAIATVIEDRLQKASTQQRDRFLIALQSYYCQQLSMGEIATKIGVRAQDAVSRLLNLKPLRADVRHQMLTQLKSAVFTQAVDYVTPEQLRDLGSQIEAALNEQLEALMQAEAQRDKTPKGLKRSETHFSKTLCTYLDQIITKGKDPDETTGLK